MTRRQTVAFGGLLAAVGAPLIALSTSAIAAADPEDFDTVVGEPLDTWGQPVDTPGTAYEVGDLHDEVYPALGNIGTFTVTTDTSALTGDTYLVSQNFSDTFADYVNGQATGDTVMSNLSGVDDFSSTTGTYTSELWGNSFVEIVNSAGNVVNVDDIVDLFGQSFTLFDFTP